jgi:hypothetical protein
VFFSMQIYNEEGGAAVFSRQMYNVKCGGNSFLGRFTVRRVGHQCFQSFLVLNNRIPLCISMHVTSEIKHKTNSLK